MTASIFRYLTTILLFCLLQSCKHADTTPALELTGTWIFQSSSGAALFGSNTYNTSDKNAPIKIDDFTELLFRKDGTGTADGTVFNYTLNSNTLVISSRGIRLTFKIVQDAGKLTLSLDEAGAKDVIDMTNPLLPASQRLTRYNKTAVYRSLEAILATNGTPGCLLTRYTYSSPGPNGTVTETVRAYFYNKERKMNGYEINSGNTVTRSDFEEYKSNLGSETDPYVIEKKNGKTNARLFADKNGRVNIVAAFSSTDENTPLFLEKHSYDNQGYRTKTETTYYQSGDKELREYEYTNGNLARIYFQRIRQNGSISTPRYLNNEYTYTSVPYKPAVVSLVNLGRADAYYLDESKTYAANGTLISASKYTYRFDDKQNVAEQKIVTSAGYVYTYVYSYNCLK